MERIELANWTLQGFNNCEPVICNSVELHRGFFGVTDEFTATVPGCVQNDLYKAGIIEDPYFNMNSIKAEWVSERWWVYKTEFDRPKTKGRVELCFDGVDYSCIIYFNDEIICEHEGMFEGIYLDVTDKLQDKNKVLVVIKDAPKEMGQIGYTSQTHTQKARFNYKWDFCTRLVHLGIYRPAYLKIRGFSKIDNYHFTVTNLEGGEAKLTTLVKALQDETITYSAILTDGDNVVYSEQKNIELKKGDNLVESDIKVENVKLWYSNGEGEQNLYDLVISINDNLGTDNIASKVGFRTIKLLQNEGAQNALPYTFELNGRKIYIKGVNMVPLDLMYGTLTIDRYQKTLTEIKDAGINLIRVWGGGLLENDEFYECCDELGILVWQEFIQSSSGIDNAPAIEKQYLELLKKNSTAGILRIRNHASLAVWSGGNELRDKNFVPVTFEDKNIKMLKDLVDMYSPEIPMLPSSPTGPFDTPKLDQKGINHDCHGPWKFYSNHYYFFNNIDSLFHSEFGADGMSCKASLKKFLSKDNIGLFNMNNNLVWRHHGEWWDTLDTCKEYFDFKNLDDFILVSQFIQAEGIRYSLEANRRRAMQNSGSIIWQYNEPWPNVSCTCLVDYYGEKKLAYYALKKAYSRVNISARYDKLVYDKGEKLNLDFYISRDNFEKSEKVKINVYFDDECVYTFEDVVLGSNIHSQKINSLEKEITANKCIRIEYISDNYSGSTILFVKGKDGKADVKVLKKYKGIL